jgi:CTP:molybdopterin cytidylyltransferase MocA
LVHGDPSKVLPVEVDDEGVIVDLDNWDDYRRLLKLWERRRQK